MERAEERLRLRLKLGLVKKWRREGDYYLVIGRIVTY